MAREYGGKIKAFKNRAGRMCASHSPLGAWKAKFMPRLLCLGQPEKPPIRRHSAAPRKGAKDGPKLHTFTILERVPVRLPAHGAVWAALRKHATRQLIIDADHPEEAFAVDVLLIDQLSGEALKAIAEVLAERRSLLLAAEKHTPDGDILAKRLDRIFERAEWLSIRNLLAAALPRAKTRQSTRRAKRNRVLLLVDA